MKIILLHPTHRKLIRKLREKYDEGAPCILTTDDRIKILEHLSTQSTTDERYRYFYRLFLRRKETCLQDQCWKVFDCAGIAELQRILWGKEMRNLARTLVNTFKLWLIRKDLHTPNN